VRKRGRGEHSPERNTRLAVISSAYTGTGGSANNAEWAMTARRMTVLPLFALALLPGAVTAQTQESNGSDAVLRPGDIVKLMIWREEAISGAFAVRQDGAV